ncbi:hypothetical protein [Brevibacillus centrosporus]|uniref:hypothetical protein n=1 Tax=Brevibacillus centrosporus TaxID=54910 RepID=UPI003B01BEC9
MLDFGAVSIEWKTVIFQLFAFILFPTLLLAGFIGIILNRSRSKRRTIEELEKRIEALENEQKRPKQ